MSKSGYVILPLEVIPESLASRKLPGEIISKKDLVSMYSATVKEINNGDNGPNSLNVKLYKCLAPYVHAELDSITKRNLQ